MIKKSTILYNFCRTLDDIADENNGLKIKKENFSKFKKDFLDKNFKDRIIREMWLIIDSEKISQAKRLASLCKEYNSLFIVNDRIDIALAVDADGIHLGQEDMPTKIARELLGAEKIIGRSTHCLEDIKNAEGEGCDYIGIGPIFPSETKKQLNPIGIDYLKKGLSETLLPAFAIEGMDKSNITKLNQINNLRIAVSNAIINSNAPFSKTKELLQFLT